MTNIRFGSDPEFFVFRHDGFAYPTILMTDDRQSRHPVLYENDIAKVVVDGVAAEVNFKRAFDSLVDIKHEFWDIFQDFKHERVMCMQVIPTANFDAKLYANYLHEDWFVDAIRFGCDPDNDAFNTRWTAKIMLVVEHQFRYGGGHIHISYSESPIQKTEAEHVVRNLAATVGLYCLAHARFKKQVIQRLNYFGMPGKYRRQEYPDGTFGIEYRTPSNDWLYFTDEEVKKIENFCRDVVNARTSLVFSDNVYEAVKEIFRTQNLDLAKEVIQDVETQLWKG